MRKITNDGRLILTGADWQRQRYKVWERDGNACVECHKYVGIRNAEIHHIKSRGMAGSTRDDRVENLQTLCGGPYGCHRKHTPI